MMRSCHLAPVVALAALLAAPSSWLSAQDAPRFDVVSIKPTSSQEPGGRVSVEGGRLMISNTPVSALVITAYELQDAFQIDGLPEWSQRDLFDLEARAPAGVRIAFPGQGTALPAMLRSMLADRMTLRAHVERRPIPMFALVTARADGRLGSGLVRSALDCSTAPTRPRDQVPQSAASDSGTKSCAARATRESFSATGIPLDRLIRLILAPRVRRPVVDRTGLTGTFDVTLRFRAPDLPTSTSAGVLEPGVDPDVPPIETAVREQLGLELRPIREPADVLVIDHIEPPTPN